jgi:hypothetical protein
VTNKKLSQLLALGGLLRDWTGLATAPIMFAMLRPVDLICQEACQHIGTTAGRERDHELDSPYRLEPAARTHQGKYQSHPGDCGGTFEKAHQAAPWMDSPDNTFIKDAVG